MSESQVLSNRPLSGVQAVIATGRPSSPLGAGVGNATAYRGELSSALLPGQPAWTCAAHSPQVNDHLEGRCFLKAN